MANIPNTSHLNVIQDFIKNMTGLNSAIPSMLENIDVRNKETSTIDKNIQSMTNLESKTESLSKSILISNKAFRDSIKVFKTTQAQRIHLTESLNRNLQSLNRTVEDMDEIKELHDEMSHLSTLQRVTANVVDGQAGSAEVMKKVLDDLSSNMDKLSPNVKDSIISLEMHAGDINKLSEIEKTLTKQTEELTHVFNNAGKSIPKFTTQLVEAQGQIKNAAEDFKNNLSSINVMGALGHFKNVIFRTAEDLSKGLNTRSVGVSIQETVADQLRMGITASDMFEMEKNFRQASFAIGGVASMREQLKDTRSAMFELTGDFKEGHTAIVQMADTFSKAGISVSKAFDLGKKGSPLRRSMDNLGRMGMSTGEVNSSLQELMQTDTVRAKLLGARSKEERRQVMMNIMSQMEERKARGETTEQMISSIKQLQGQIDAPLRDRVKESMQLLQASKLLGVSGGEEASSLIRKGAHRTQEDNDRLNEFLLNVKNANAAQRTRGGPNAEFGDILTDRFQPLIQKFTSGLADDKLLEERKFKEGDATTKPMNEINNTLTKGLEIGKMAQNALHTQLGDIGKGVWELKGLVTGIAASMSALVAGKGASGVGAGVAGLAAAGGGIRALGGLALRMVPFVGTAIAVGTIAKMGYDYFTKDDKNDNQSDNMMNEAAKTRMVAEQNVKSTNDINTKAMNEAAKTRMVAEQNVKQMKTSLDINKRTLTVMDNIYDTSRQGKELTKNLVDANKQDAHDTKNRLLKLADIRKSSNEIKDDFTKSKNISDIKLMNRKNNTIDTDITNSFLYKQAGKKIPEAVTDYKERVKHEEMVAKALLLQSHQNKQLLDMNKSHYDKIEKIADEDLLENKRNNRLPANYRG